MGAEEAGAAGDEDALDHGREILRETPLAEAKPQRDHTRMTHPVPATTDRPRFVVGTMTGTSIDGELDAALAEIRGHGLAMTVRLVAHESRPLGAVAADLRRIAAQEPCTAGDIARVARAFGAIHADAVAALAGGAGVQPDLAVLHGQTVFHAPPHSWQLLDPWPVAARVGCRVRYDLRGANLASGGEGAPITPLADFVLFARECAPLVVLNLGGFVNATILPERTKGTTAIRGFDACACNHLLDRVARDRLGAAFDADGASAQRGVADPALRDEISRSIAPPRAAGSARRSLGTGDEAARLVSRTASLAPADACRTIVEAIADAIVRTVEQEIGRADGQPLPAFRIAGGSARNRALRDALAERARCEVLDTEQSDGVPVHVREPLEIAVLGALADDGVRYSLPQVTGAASRAPESAVLEAAIARDHAQV
jgi:1,6-anhydro-N-acetylmuramate kinase